MDKQQGFTLIETMIIVAIIGILAVMGSAFTVNWVRQAELNKATASLESAVNLARSTAIRNATGLTGNQTTGHICFSNNILSVHGGDTAGTESACDTTTLYNFQIADNISIKAHGETNNFACITFNSRGQVVTATSCTTNSPLTIANAGGSESYVFK